MEKKVYGADFITELPADVTCHIKRFRNYLAGVWHIMEELIKNHDWEKDPHFIEDWLQANWEYLVEQELLGLGKYLMPFRRCAFGKRIKNPDEIPGYVIRVDPDLFIDAESGKLVKTPRPLRLCGFSMPMEKGYAVKPPFYYGDMVDDETGKCYRWCLVSMRFSLVKLEEPH